MPPDDNSPNLATDVAMEAAREWARRSAEDPSGPDLGPMTEDEAQFMAMAKAVAMEAFLAGAAWQSAQSAKLLAGVVRERDHRGQ